MRAPGVYKDINIDVYHSEEGISSSGINLILDCPKRYWHEYLSDEPKPGKDKCFQLGSALHMLALEPNRFHENYYLMTEEVDLRTKAGKEAYARHEEEAEGKTIIRSKDAELIQGMGLSVSSHRIWGTLGEEKNIEQSIYWDAGIYKTRLRARPDFYTDSIIIDLKTTDSIPSFKKSIFQYGYHRQAAMQIDGLKACDGKTRMFGLFVVEKKAPYLTACFTLDEECIEKGREEYLDAAAIYSECLKYNVWDGYKETFSLVKLPRWMEKEES